MQNQLAIKTTNQPRLHPVKGDFPQNNKSTRLLKRPQEKTPSVCQGYQTTGSGGRQNR